MRALRSRLPKALEALLRPLPHTVPIALSEAQREVEVSCELGSGRIDVTERCVVVSLAPFKIAIGSSGECELARALAPLPLTFRDRRTATELAELELWPDCIWSPVPGLKLLVVDVGEGRHRCFNWLRR